MVRPAHAVAEVGAHLGGEGRLADAGGAVDAEEAVAGGHRRDAEVGDLGAADEEAGGRQVDDGRLLEARRPLLGRPAPLRQLLFPNRVVVETLARQQQKLRRVLLHARLRTVAYRLLGVLKGGAHRVAPPRAVAAEQGVVKRLRKLARRRVGHRGVGLDADHVTDARADEGGAGRLRVASADDDAADARGLADDRLQPVRPQLVQRAVSVLVREERAVVGAAAAAAAAGDLHAVARVVQHPAALGRDHRQCRARRHADQHADVT